MANPSNQSLPRTQWTPQIHVQLQAPLQRSYQIPGYQDYASAQFPPALQEDSMSMLLATPFHLANRCKSSDLVFPQKLHMLLTATELDPELASIVSWKVHGRAFAVHDRKRFLKEVLPEWFLQSRFESFQRQLNLYGFNRITTGPDRGASYHQLFLRQRPLLAARIQRLRLKGKGPRKPAKPELEPNFYRMTLLPTYEMVKNRSDSMTYPCSTSHPRQNPTLAPKPPAPTSYPTVVAPNPNGLCGLMMRPLAYAGGQPCPQATGSFPPEKATHGPRSNPGAGKPSLVSAPPSPVIVPRAVPAPLPRKTPAVLGQGGQTKNPPVPLQAFSQEAAGHPQQTITPSAPNLPNYRALAPAPCTVPHAPVPRCVSQATLGDSTAPQASEGTPQSSHKTPPAPSEALLEVGSAALALMAESMEEHAQEGEVGDEDFALILAELAGGKLTCTV